MPTRELEAEGWFQQLNPLRHGSPDEARSGRLAVLLSVVLMVAASTYAGLFLYMQLWLPTASVGMAILFALGVLFGFKHYPSVRAAAHVLAGADYLAVLGATWATGGLQSVALASFVVPPMLAALLNGRRAGLVWAGASVACISGLYGLELAGVEISNELPAALTELFDFVVPAGLVVVAFSFVWSYELSREEAMHRLRGARDDAKRAHAHARAILDNVNEGLVIVRDDGVLQPARSAALERWFGTPPEDAHVWDVLEARAPGVAEQVELGWDQIGAGWLPPDVALEQLPTRLTGDDQILELQWSPAGDGGEIMFVATDVTAQLQAEEERREQEELVNILARIGRSRQQVVDFASDARRIVDALIGREGSDAQERRWIHTLKGNAAVMGLGRLASWLHALETALADEQRPATDAERAALDEHWTRYESRIDEVVGSDDQHTVRVPSAELDEAIDRLAAGEARARVVARLESWTWDDAHNRMAHLAEQARRLAHRMDKSIDVTIDAADVRTPPTRAWRELWASLVHLVRNAVDHGLEQDRAAAGKSGSGQLTLRAQRVDDTLQIEVLDDGAGIDWGTLEAKANTCGESLQTDADRVAWLFSDGVTSKDEVSEISGRGVGTSAVRELVDALGGTITVQSELGRFTRFVLALPLDAAELAANGGHAARSA